MSCVPPRTLTVASLSGHPRRYPAAGARKCSRRTLPPPQPRPGSHRHCRRYFPTALQPLACRPPTPRRCKHSRLSEVQRSWVRRTGKQGGPGDAGGAGWSRHRGCGFESGRRQRGSAEVDARGDQVALCTGVYALLKHENQEALCTGVLQASSP